MKNTNKDAMIMRHDIQQDLYRFENDTVTTKWYEDIKDARAEYDSLVKGKDHVYQGFDVLDELGHI